MTFNRHPYTLSPAWRLERVGRLGAYCGVNGPDSRQDRRGALDGGLACEEQSEGRGAGTAGEFAHRNQRAAETVEREPARGQLLTELASGSGGLAIVAGQASPAPLAQLARDLADGDTPEETFVGLAPGLRLIATRPAAHAPPERAALETLLDQARAAHGLVIVDCGTDHTAARPVLQRASHILWTLPATSAGAVRAHALLASDVLPASGHAREVLAAITRDGGSAVRVRALRRIAQPRCDRAVLVPHTRSPLTVDEAIAPALTALASPLRRAP